MDHIEFEHVRKQYSGNREETVKDFNLQIRAGEFIVFVGPSGCGKSTTLRMLAGLETISGGVIKIDGRVINRVEPKDRGIAMVFQNYALYPFLSVYDNIGFGLKIRKVDRKTRDQKIRSAAAMLGLENYLERRPAELSGGQRQRVALGRAVVNNAQIFLMDEPLSNLDAKLRGQMREEIIRLHQQLQATMIYVTHDQIEAMTMADRVVVMNHGVIQQVGTPLDLYMHPANRFVAGFIGSPPMNFLPVRVQAGRLWLDESICLLDDARLMQVPEGAYDLGVRPEALSLASEGPRAVVEVRELLGADCHLHLKMGQHRLLLRQGLGEEPLETGAVVRPRLQYETLYLFDPNTERCCLSQGRLQLPQSESSAEPLTAQEQSA